MHIGLTTALVVLLVLPALALSPPCALCHAMVKQIQKSVPQRPFEVALDVIASRYCIKKKIDASNVCKGAIHEMGSSIINSIWRHETDPHTVCHKIRVCPQQYVKRDLKSDIQKILEGNPQKEWEMPTKRRTLKVMHISDLHPDLFYTVGANQKCSEPVCCRANVTTKQSPWDILKKIDRGEVPRVQSQGGEGAGYYGSLSNCDLPMQTFDVFASQIASHKPDLILWTGDNTPHDIWQQSQSYNLNFTFILTEKLKKATNARVIAAMGNHESFPVNVYDYEGERQNMLNEGLASVWKGWLDEQAYQMLRTKGYYSMVVPELNNLKIISVNTQAQNDMNWFLLRNPTDPGHMLDWIQAELKASQEAQQFAYIIGHIYPASALNDWSMRFNALTERYSFTIRGHFYGHSHRDHIGFFPKYNNHDELSAFYFVAPSITTYSNKHPEYRVMTVDYDSLQVLDYDQYLFDLNKHKQKDEEAHFQLFYSFKKAYNLTDTTIRGGMTQLMGRIRDDPETQKLYTYLKSAGTEKGTSGHNVFCDTMTSPQYSAQCRGKQHSPGKLEKFAGGWRDLKEKH